MRIKTLISIVLGIGAAVVLQSSVFAAGSVDVGTISTYNESTGGYEVKSDFSAGDEVYVPIKVGCTDYSDLKVYGMELHFDATKYEYDGTYNEDLLTYTSGRTTNYYGSYSTNLLDRTGDGVKDTLKCIYVCMLASEDLLPQITAEPQTIAYFHFTALQDVTVDAVNDFWIDEYEINDFWANAPKNGYGTYLLLDIPLDYSLFASYGYEEVGYIHGLSVKVGDSDAKSLTSYLETTDSDGNDIARFVIRLLPSTTGKKTIADVTILADVAETEDATETTQIEFAKVANVSIEANTY